METQSESNIIVCAEFSYDLELRYLPLVNEIRASYPASRIIGLFVLFGKIAGQNSFDGLFDETHLFVGPEQATAYTKSVDCDRLFIFVDHNATIRDYCLYAAFKKTKQPAQCVLRNRLSLRNVLRKNILGDDSVCRKLKIARRTHFATSIKVCLLGWVALFFLSLAKLYRQFLHVSNPGKQKILFIKLDLLGDMIVALPYLQELRRKYADAELTIMASRRGAVILEEQSLLHKNGLYDHLLVWDAPWHFKRQVLQGAIDLLSILSRLPSLWRQGFDVVIQPVAFGTGVFFSLLTFGHRVVAVIDPVLPLAQRMRRFVSDPVDMVHDRQYHLKDLVEMSLRHLGIEKNNEAPRLLIDETARQRMSFWSKRHGHEDSRKLVLVNVGAGSPLRVWGQKKFAELINALYAVFAVTVVLVGSNAEKAIAAEIEALAGVPLINSVGCLSLNELIALASDSSLVITVDTGIMHLAAATNTPLVAIFGAGHVDYCKPISNNYRIVKEELGCSGCADRCFIEGYPPCLERVTVDAVFDAVHQILGCRI
jgi:ADP-heptose:LPS heptosyltransferase